MDTCGGCFAIQNPQIDWMRSKWRLSHKPCVRGNLINTYYDSIHGKFKIESENLLGMGSSGLVVKACELETNLEYAIKLVRNPDIHRIRINREIHLLKDIDHTNVIKLFSVYDSPKEVAFVLELCTGGDLGELLTAQPSRCR